MTQAQKLLADWLKAEGRKQKWLAAQVKCGESTLRSWLKGRAAPVRVYREALAEVTGLPIADEDAWR